MGWFDELKGRLTGLFKSVAARKKPEGHKAYDRHLKSGKTVHVGQKGVVKPPAARKPRVKKLDYVEPAAPAAPRKIEELRGNAHEVGQKRNIGGDASHQKAIEGAVKKVRRDVKAGKLLTVGAEVKYKVGGDTYYRTGRVIKVGKQHYHIEGKRDNQGNRPTHKLMHDAVIPLKDYAKYTAPKEQAGREKVATGKTTVNRLTAGTLVERKQIAQNRIGIPDFEDVILSHPSFLGPAFKIVSDLAKQNGMSVEIDKNQGGNFWNHAKDADYQDALFAYATGAMGAWRRLLAEKETKHNKDVIDENVRQFRDVLLNRRQSSYITAAMQREGKNSALAHIKALNDRRRASDSIDALEDPEHPGSKHFQGKIGSQPQQLKYTLAANNERLTDDVKKLVAGLKPDEREVLKLKLGMHPHGKPHTAKEIVEKLNGQEQGQVWDTAKVNAVMDSVLAKIRASQQAMDDLSFHVDAKLGRDVWKSDEELVADLKKSYPDAIVAVNKMGICVMLDDDLMKSFSSDLKEKYPGGEWMTVKRGLLEGRHIYTLRNSDDMLIKSAMDELTQFLSEAQRGA